MARDDFRRRMDGLGQGESPLCPYVYKVWARGIDGEYRVAGEIRDAIQNPQRTRKQAS